ncbi:hypothetical protein DEO72_LG11g1845 [Vigna unguiculata]|uniref:Uncharacterized protein n=1 Tax=Vigna unguiculata TaxID=3917 RepID=A0A4D6NQP7_VIGUN|nr:hypothetical protein DEO72_LG11g1845 [Vigna unguiculata]
MFSFQLLLLFVAFSFSNNPIFCNDNCIGKINTHFSLFFARPEGRPCPTQISVSDTASYALPTGVRVRCASDSGKRGSNTMSELHSAQVSSRPRLGKPFSPERENLSLNTDTGRPSEKLEPKTLNEILQLSLRRERLAWAKLAESLQTCFPPFLASSIISAALGASCLHQAPSVNQLRWRRVVASTLVDPACTVQRLCNRGEQVAMLYH